MAVSANSARPVLSSATLLLIGVGSRNMQTTELFRTFQDVIVPEKPAVHCSKHSRRLYFFFSSSLADVALKARSLHEHKLSERHLYKDRKCPFEQQAVRNKQNKNRRKPQTRRPANPPARLAFRQRKQRSKQQKTKTNKNGARAQQEHPQFDLPRDTVACPLHHAQKHANEFRTTAFEQT